MLSYLCGSIAVVKARVLVEIKSPNQVDGYVDNIKAYTKFPLLDYNPQKKKFRLCC